MAGRIFVLQMAGLPGAGKSALARVIGHRTATVVIDKDVLKTAALEAGAEETLAGGIAYEAFFALADHLLGQGLGVVLDSPSFYDTIPAKGSALAAQRGVPYYFIECVCADRDELARRLRERSRVQSQPGEESLESSPTTLGPAEPYLRIDTTQPLDQCLALALDYLGLNGAEA